MPTIITFDILYLLGVTALTGFFYYFLATSAERVKRKRIQRFKKTSQVDPVETDSPLEDPVKVAQAIGLESIETRFNFMRKALPIFTFTLWAFLAAIPHLEKVPAIYISIIVAISSVIVGMAARPFIENLVAGMVLSFSQPIRIGDTVRIDGEYGVIEEIGLTHSTIKIWDWRRLVIPNQRLLQKEVINYSLNDFYLWAYVEFYVSPESDLAEVERLAKKTAREAPHFNNSENPAFWVMGMEKDSIKCWVAAWSDNPTAAWELKNEIRTNLLKEFQKQGINFHSLIVDGRNSSAANYARPPVPVEK